MRNDTGLECGIKQVGAAQAKPGLHRFGATLQPRHRRGTPKQTSIVAEREGRVVFGLKLLHPPSHAGAQRAMRGQKRRRHVAALGVGDEPEAIQPPDMFAFDHHLAVVAHGADQRAWPFHAAHQRG